MSIENIVDIARRKNAGYAHVGLFDLYGTFRERRVSIDNLTVLLGGSPAFVNVLPAWDAAETVVGTGPFIGEPISLDERTLRDYPFEKNAVLIIADYAGELRKLSPRTVLKQQMDQLKTLGLDALASLEYEFLVLNQNAESLREDGFCNPALFAPDNRCWSGESAAAHADLVSQLSAILATGGVEPLTLGLELGPGCFEATMGCREPLMAADDASLFKLFTRSFFRCRGQTATFMAQMSSGSPGLSGHVHFSLRDPDTGKNLFFDAADELHMSGSFRQFVAGMLALAPEAMALTHHTANSYRRHAPGNWAPKSASWAVQNYSAAIRVVSDNEQNCRLEYRLPGSDTNPYLALAFVIGAGLHGIRQQLELPEMFDGGGPDDFPPSSNPLPHDILSASRRLAASGSARAIWGDRFVDYLSHACAAEDIALRRITAAEERARYLEVV